MSVIKLTLEEITWLKEQVKKEKENEYSKNNKGHVCQMCGMVQIINTKVDSMGFEENKWHHLKRQECSKPGYGSELDGIDINFELCDICMGKLIDKFKIPLDVEEYFYNEKDFLE